MGQIKKIKISIVDDQPLFRDGTKKLLAAFRQCELLNEANSLCEYKRLLVSDVPDVVIINLSKEGQQLMRYLSAYYPKIKVFDPSLDHSFRIWNLTSCKLHRNILNSTAAENVEEREGLTSSCSTVMRAMLRNIFIVFIQTLKTNNGTDKKILNEQEERVIALIRCGYKDKEIGEELFISHRTVETYVNRIKGKIEATRRSDLIEYGIAHNLAEKYGYENRIKRVLLG